SVTDTTARWTQSLLRGDSLQAAWAEAGDGFEFEAWLVQALQCGWIARAVCIA
ncbi:MAG: hypothetical protein H7Y33_09170, partial [Cytophagales bacterium]|nr:hypothetical protein [Rhizobacter sp.]